MTFDDLVAPWEAERFWSEAWERGPLHIPGRTADHYDALATATEIEDLLFGSGRLPAEAVRLYRGAEAIAPDSASGAELRQLHDGGYTIVVASADRFLPRLAAQLASLEARFKAKCVAHLVASPARAEGLAPHSDAYGVFALQIAGSKTWSLYEDGPRSTVNHGIDQHQLIGAPPSSRIPMAAGDLLYLPRGTIHAGVTTDERSLHLAVAIIPPRGADALALLCAIAESDPFFRDYMPYGIGETPEKRAHYAEAFRARLVALIGRTDIFALLDRRRSDRAAAAKRGGPKAER